MGDAECAANRRDLLRFGCAFQIGAAKTKRALEAAVLVEHNTGSDECGPRQMIGQAIGALAIFVQR